MFLIILIIVNIPHWYIEDIPCKVLWSKKYNFYIFPTNSLIFPSNNSLSLFEYIEDKYEKKLMNKYQKEVIKIIMRWRSLPFKDSLLCFSGTSRETNHESQIHILYPNKFLSIQFKKPKRSKSIIKLLLGKSSLNLLYFYLL